MGFPGLNTQRLDKLDKLDKLVRLDSLKIAICLVSKTSH